MWEWETNESVTSANKLTWHGNEKKGDLSSNWKTSGDKLLYLGGPYHLACKYKCDEWATVYGNSAMPSEQYMKMKNENVTLFQNQPYKINYYSI